MNTEQMIHCPACGLPWSLDPEEYPWLHYEEYIICVCGEPLAKKLELLGEEYSILQPA